jgi:hypothetical protein
LTPDNALVRWGNALDEAMRKSGPVRPTEELLKTRLEKAGFVDVQAFIVKQPIGPWPKAKYGSLDYLSNTYSQERGNKDNNR